MEENNTTAAVQYYLDELGGIKGDEAEPIIRALLERSVKRLQLLSAMMLHRSYPRLARAPLNLETNEVLSAVVERLLKALRKARPTNVRQFFSLANQHMRWELNDLARRLDEHAPVAAIAEDLCPAPQSSGSGLSSTAHRILDAIEKLPEDEREVFSMVRIQGISQVEAAALLEVSAKTIQRRLNRSLMLLAEALADLQGDGNA
jgi:RNA polymerase sigma-70 factor (ECF subfamily)